MAYTYDAETINPNWKRFNPNTMYKATISLQQHTPIIHFQHDQEGATLRATEVKPKLDRFIFQRFKSLFPEERNLYTALEVFNPETKSNSAYKLQVVNPFEPQKILIASYLKSDYKRLLETHEIPFLHGMPYFAQESEITKLFAEDGEETDRRGRTRKKYKLVKERLGEVTKWGMMNKAEDPIELNFFSWNTSVIKIIKLIAPYFFAYENFGTRQSKGFGCFSVVNPSTSLSYKQLIKAVYPIRYWTEFDELPNSQIRRLQKILEEIHSDYKLVKSGKSQKEGGDYKKSLLFLYGLQGKNPIRWEKRKIKQDINANPFDQHGRTIELMSENHNEPIFNEHGDQSWSDPTLYQYEYIRAILGLSEQLEFQTKSSRNPSKAGPDKYIVQIKSNDGIDRFKSPITFKVHNRSIYLLAEEPNPDILGKTFEFYLKLKLNNKLSKQRSHERPMFPLQTPSSFSMAAFLQFALETSPEAISGYTSF